MAPDSELDSDRGSDDIFPFDHEVLEDDNYVHAQREETLEEGLEKARGVIKKKRRFITEEDVEEFLDEFREVAGRSSSKAVGNLLHVLVEVVKHNDVEPNGVELLVRQLVKRFPDLLRYTDNHGQNPIFMAIKNLQDELINYMISACVEDKGDETAAICLRDALSMKQGGKTCLHAALREKVKARTIRMLFENAPDEALEVQDEHQKTPMHHAVAFSKCTDTRTELIQFLIQRDLSARSTKGRSEKTFLDLLDHKGSSVFREHQKTRINTTSRWEKENQLAEGNKRDQVALSKTGDRPTTKDPESMGSTGDLNSAASAEVAAGPIAVRNGGGGDGLNGPGEHQRMHPQKKNKQSAKLEEEEKDEERGRPSECDKHLNGASIPLSDLSRNTSFRIRSPDSNTAVRTSNQISYMLTRIPSPDSTTAVRTPLTRIPSPDSNIAVRTSNETPVVEPIPNSGIKRRSTAPLDITLDQEKEKKPTEPEQTNRSKAMANYIKNSNKILESLKLHYMRTRNAEMVISFLYGNNMEGESI